MQRARLGTDARIRQGFRRRSALRRDGARITRRALHGAFLPNVVRRGIGVAAHFALVRIMLRKRAAMPSARRNAVRGREQPSVGRHVFDLFRRRGKELLIDLRCDRRYDRAHRHADDRSRDADPRRKQHRRHRRQGASKLRDRDVVEQAAPKRCGRFLRRFRFFGHKPSFPASASCCDHTRRI